MVAAMGETLDRISSICRIHDLKPLALEVKKAKKSHKRSRKPNATNVYL